MTKIQTTAYYLILIVLLAVFSNCRRNEQSYSITKTLVCEQAAVVSAHPLASQIGLDILQQGGNAIDAAISVQFALAVCYPIAGNIGGGGFLVYRDSSGVVDALDFREKAPEAAFETMYQDSLGNIIEGSSRMGHLAVGVPGTVDGMVKAFEKYSKLKDWSALVQPAIDLANNGFPLTKAQALNLNAEQDIFRKYNEESCAFIVKDRFKTNNILIQKALGETLERIRDQGRAGFYSGKTAELLLAEMNEHQALISQHDLVTYSSIWRKPIISTYKNYKIIGMPPPSSGGIILAQMLGMVEHFPLNTMGFQSAASVHLMVEAERRAYADRAIHLGDADFYQVPVESLLDSIYILARMEDLDLNKAGKSNDVLAGFIKQSEETTHFSIIDQWGNAVSLTTTLNDGFGSRIVVDGAGFLLNNEMDDFSIKPGVPNLYGLIGAEANKVEGGKRMLSSMTPTIVEKDDHLFMIVGTPGGSTIITSVFQVFLNITEFGLSAYEAVASPRFHHQWLPDQIYVEKDCLDNETKATLMAMGHKIKTRSNIGRVELILIEQNGKIHAVADPRGDDHVSGY